MILTLKECEKRMEKNGGSLDLRGTQITAAERHKVKRFMTGQITPFWIYADGQLFHYAGRSHKRDAYTCYVGKIKGTYLVTDGEFWAHCKSFRAGVADIIFKRAEDRGAEQYRNIDREKVYSVDELKIMYRVITGACQAGTEAFVNSVKDLKDGYTIAEAVELTRGQYNSEAFSRFFEEG